MRWRSATSTGAEGGDLLAAGAAWGDSAREVAETSDIVITSLPSPGAVSAVMEGADGVFAELRAGATWIEMSTTDKDEVLRLAARGAAQGVATLEAPITGGCHRAKSGNITILAGGERADFKRCLPVLEAMGGPVLYMGVLGNASVAKVITNMLAFVHLVAVGEGLMLACKGGIDLRDAFEAIKASSGNSFVHETESQVILKGSYDIGFTMDLACKDLRLARGLGEALCVPLELAGHVEEIFARGRARYGDRAWSTQIVKLLEDACGTDLRAPGFPAVLEDR